MKNVINGLINNNNIIINNIIIYLIMGLTFPADTLLMRASDARINIFILMVRFSQHSMNSGCLGRLLL